MSEMLERIFPGNECLSEELVSVSEDTLQHDLVYFFMVHGPDTFHPLSAQVHIEKPFSYSHEQRARHHIEYDALFRYPWQMAQIRKKALESDM